MRSRASSPAPSIREDFRRRRNGMPIRYMPGDGDHAAVVADAALAVEDRDVEPGIVGPEAGRPDDGPDRRPSSRSRPSGGDASTSVGAESDAAAAPRRRGRVAVAHSSMRSSSRVIFRSASAHWLRSEPENCALPSLIAGEPADELDADRA